MELAWGPGHDLQAEEKARHCPSETLSCQDSYCPWGETRPEVLLLGCCPASPQEGRACQWPGLSWAGWPISRTPRPEVLLEPWEGICGDPRAQGLAFTGLQTGGAGPRPAVLCRTCRGTVAILPVCSLWGPPTPVSGWHQVGLCYQLDR